ncbi:MAG: hypothetical protein IJF24_05125 [Clostridia bacterium]|nr:hypothetical protein [Clostridia bacterium]
MKKFLSLIAVILVLATVLTVSVSAAEKITISSAKSDTTYKNIDQATGLDKAGAESAVENLRPSVGLWYNGSTTYEPSADSIAQAGERYLTLGLAQDADISSIKIQWYQGGSSVTDITGEKARTYFFKIEASDKAEGEDNFTQIYPASGDGTSGTGTDFEEYTCTFANAKRIRIWGYGNDGGSDNLGAYNFAIRNIEVYGTGKGGSGANVGGSASSQGSVDKNDGSGNIKDDSNTGNGSTTNPGGNGGNGGSQAPTTGDFENLLIFGTVAVLSCAAVVIIRKKIRER